MATALLVSSARLGCALTGCRRPRTLPFYGASRAAGCPPKRRSCCSPRAQAPPNGGAPGAAAPFPGDGGTSDGFDGFITPPPQPQQPAGGSDGKAAGGGPLAALKGVLLAYDRAAKSHPVPTKALTSFFGFALGDRIAQTVAAGTFDPYRCLRLSLYGLLLDGPVGHAWYKLLDKHVCPEAPTSNKAVLIKTALDQLVWGPVMTLVFFAFLKTLEGRPDLIMSTISSKFAATMLANYALWPLAHLINFKLVPTDWRIFFNNVVAVFWTAYLSWLCGGPSTGLPTGGDTGMLHAGVDASAAAASALFTAIPCSKVPGVLQTPAMAEAVRHVAAMEQILAGWGTKSLNADSLLAYLELKADVIHQVCQAPIRLP